MDDPAVGGIDIDAIGEAIRALDDHGIDVEVVERIDRSGDDGRVRWEMTCEADTRMADLVAFLLVSASLAVSGIYSLALLALITNTDPKRWIALRVVRLFIRLGLVEDRSAGWE